VNGVVVNALTNICLGKVRVKKSWGLNDNFFFLNKLNRSLATSQSHSCPICMESLYNGESLHKHHIIPFKEGGPTTFSNLVLIHQPCHIKITFSKDKVRILETQNSLLEYRNNHPNRLERYFKEQKKAGRKRSDITEFEISENIDQISTD
jgi:hypothetical protein